MQSSGMVAFRATIMIVCMVALPLAAVVGTALPKAVQSAIQGAAKPEPQNSDERLDSATAPDEFQTATSPTEVPAAAAEALARSDGLPRARITAIRPVGMQAPSAGANEPPGRASGEQEPTASLWSRDAAATARRVQSAAERQPQRRPRAASPGEPPPRRRGESPLKATAYSAPIASEADGADRARSADRRSAASAEPTADDPLSRGERRLRELGASWYRLETWGVTGELYRFSCKVPLANQAQAARHFEATETTPAKVIEAVVEQVETWQAKRR
jgi:hypothetical protein